MNLLRRQGRLEKYARQDHNKGKIDALNRRLDEAIEGFSVRDLSVCAVLTRTRCNGFDLQMSLQLSAHRLHYESALRLISLEVTSRHRHGEILDVSRMSESEREVRYRSWS